MKKNMKKNIFFLKISEGFGNKILNLIIGLYIKYINNAEFNTIIIKSKHETNIDKNIIDIFPKIKEFVNIHNNWDKVEKHFQGKERNEINCNTIKKISDLKFSFEKVIFIKKPYNCYFYIYDIFNKLPESYKNIFEINASLIDNKIKVLTLDDYIVVHIRYGDKLKLSLNKENRFIYLMYTPEYYINMIINLLKKKNNKKIYIITDDIKIVTNFIMKKIKSSNVILLDIPFFESFYILSKATYIVLSISSFSILATLINKKLKTAYYLERPLDISKYAIGEESIIKNNDKVKIIDDKKYILNYNFKLMLKMIKSKK